MDRHLQKHRAVWRTEPGAAPGPKTPGGNPTRWRYIAAAATNDADSAAPTGARPFGVLCHLTVLLVALSGCAGESGDTGPRGSAGEDGSSCSVSTEEGKATITCPDGSKTILEASVCTVESAQGVHTIHCPGADPVALSDGDRLPNGSILGTAIRFGLPPIAGIEVEIVGSSIRPGTTNEDGEFRLNAVPPGVHRVRIQAEGYQPLEIPNVLLLGDAADLGAQILKRGRLLATGVLEPILSPNEERIALQHIDPFANGDEVGVSVVDLTGDTVRWIGDEIVDLQFLSDRFLLVGRLWDFDSFELFVHDLDSDEILELGPALGYFRASGGLLYWTTDDDGPALRFLTLPDLQTHELEGELDHDAYRFEEQDGSQRFVRIVIDDDPLPGLWIFDSEEPDRPLLPLWSDSIAFDPETGSLAFSLVGEPEGALVVLDPSTGTTENLGPPTHGSLVWSPGAAYLAAGYDDEFVIFDRATGEQTSWTHPPAMQRLRFSPSGKRLVASVSGGNSLLADWSSGLSAGLPWGDNVAFSASERWAAACIAGAVRTIDTDDFSSTDRAMGCDDTFFIDELLFVVVGYREMLRIDLETGEERTLEVIAPPLGTTRAIAAAGIGYARGQASEESDEFILVDLLTQATYPTGLSADDWFWSENPNYLFVFTDDAFHLVDTRDGSSLPIDRDLFDFWGGESGLLYITSDNPFLGPAATGGSSIFDDMESYWISYP